MIRQWFAWCAPARSAVRRRHFPLGLGVVGLQVFELQFKLFDLVIKLLGLAAELHAPQFSDLQFQVFNLCSTRRQLGLHVQQCVTLGGDSRITLPYPALAGQQQRLQGIDVVGAGRLS